MYKTLILSVIVFLSVSCKQEKPKPVVVKKISHDSVIVFDTAQMPKAMANDSFSNAPEVKDIDGNIYETVRIGSQVWMAKNLKVKHYRNGDEIPNVKSDKTWSYLSTGAWCYYKNGHSYGKTYGKLYNWYAVGDKRGLAPEGWHIPSDDEWEELMTYLGNNIDANVKLKEKGTAHWRIPNEDATNSSGFSALPGGLRFSHGSSFDCLSDFGYWWSSTEEEQNGDAMGWYTNYSYSYGMGTFFYNKKWGFSVRCIKD
jgi:uncharacterized protein (TIGR02145 family)